MSRIAYLSAETTPVFLGHTLGYRHGRHSPRLSTTNLTIAFLYEVLCNLGRLTRAYKTMMRLYYLGK